MKARHVEPLLLTVREAAEALRLGDNEVRQWVKDGRIPSVRWRPTAHPLIPLAALRELIDKASKQESGFVSRSTLLYVTLAVLVALISALLVISVPALAAVAS